MGTTHDTVVSEIQQSFGVSPVMRLLEPLSELPMDGGTVPRGSLQRVGISHIIRHSRKIGGGVGAFDAIPYPQINPVFLEFGPLQFRWYGLMYLIGLAAAFFLMKRKATAKALPIRPDQIYDMVVFAAFGVFIGGRIGYTLFYNFPYYSQHPLKIFAVWEGGMSFHGGLLGTIVALLWFSKRRGLSVYTVADLAASVTPIGLGFGRLGNFINGELYGRATDVAWCMVFPGGGTACRHPSQLYEAGLEGLLLFTTLWLIGRWATPPGTIFWGFLTGYGLCRLIVELFREPDQHLGFLFAEITMGQLLSAPMVLVGLIMLAWGFYKASPNPSPRAKL